MHAAACIALGALSGLTRLEVMPTGSGNDHEAILDDFAPLYALQWLFHLDVSVADVAATSTRTLGLALRDLTVLTYLAIRSPLHGIDLGAFNPFWGALAQLTQLAHLEAGSLDAETSGVNLAAGTDQRAVAQGGARAKVCK